MSQFLLPVVGSLSVLSIYLLNQILCFCGVRVFFTCDKQVGFFSAMCLHEMTMVGSWGGLGWGGELWELCIIGRVGGAGNLSLPLP